MQLIKIPFQPFWLGWPKYYQNDLMFMIGDKCYEWNMYFNPKTQSHEMKMELVNKDYYEAV